MADDAFASIPAALDALVEGRADFETVAAWLCALPVVEQAPPPPYWVDVWIGADGPVTEVQQAFFRHRITSAQRTELTRRMREVGHSA